MKNKELKIKRWSWILMDDPEESFWVKVMNPRAGKEGQYFMGRGAKSDPIVSYHRNRIIRVAEDKEKITELQRLYHYR